MQNEHAVIGGQAHLVGKFRPDGQSAHAQAWPAHRAIADKVADDRLGHVDGNGETQTGALSGGAENKAVDADDVAARVQQRPAGVARVDSGIGLNSFIQQHAAGAAHRTQRTDDAARHGAGQPEGIADGINLLAHFQRARVAQRGRLQAGALDLDDGEIVDFIQPDYTGTIFFLV